MPITSSIEQQLVSIVGAQNLRAGTALDNISGVLPRVVVEPENEQQLAGVLSFANENGLTVSPRGGGTKLEWGNPPKRAELVLSTVHFNRILDHAWADLTVTVEAGCTLKCLQQTLAQHGQRLAFDGLWPERSTIGGVLSTNDSGALRLRFGALRDLIIGVTLALPDGTLANSGGKVVKNVAGYDLPKLATGALGTLGVITRAVFRVHPLPYGAKTLSFSAETFTVLQDQILAIQDSNLAHTALQMRGTSEAQPCVDILFEATDAGISAQESQLRKLLRSSAVAQSADFVWTSRPALWNDSDNALIAKMTFLPADIANLSTALQTSASTYALRWNIVAQTIGIATVRLEGQPAQLLAAIQRLRDEREGSGGSLLVLHRPAGLESLDVWGNPGDTLPLMQAVKNQLDPKNILNPGRFLGGI